MRTTVDLDPDLLRELKRRAADSGRTMSDVLHDLVRASLAQRQAPQRRRERVILVTFSGAPEPGLRPGVDLSNNADLLEILDEEESAVWRARTGGRE